MHTRFHKVLVDEAWIDKAESDQWFSVPDVSGTAFVDRRMALYHAKNGALVFAVVRDIKRMKKGTP